MRRQRALLVLGFLVGIAVVIRFASFAVAPSPSVPRGTPTPTPTITPRPTRTPQPTETPLPPTLTPAFTESPTTTPLPGEPTSTAAPTATRRPTSTPLPSGRSAWPTLEFASAALGDKALPDSKNCRWVEGQGNARIGCTLQVYLPPGYFDSGRRYPVVYLLHGWGGEYAEFGWFGTQPLADEMIRNGEIPPMIIVTPEGDKAYWFNHANNGPRWGDYVAIEIVDFIDRTYRTIPRRESRAIGGLSMGALGAIQLALNHPDTFSIVGMRSPSLRRVGDPDIPAFFGSQEYYAQYDPFVLAAKGESVRRLAVYVIIGSTDPWLGRTLEFRELLRTKNVEVEWHEHPGEHDVEFFKSYIEEDLLYYGSRLSTAP